MPRPQAVPKLAKTVTRRLTPDDWPVLERLFGPNGACGGCWCMSWRIPQGGKLWEQNKGEPNRRAFRRLVCAGKVHGCLAFAEDEPIGWCCVGPRADFPRLARVKALQTDWTEHTWSVTCFFIRTGWRKKGVARALLAEAVKLARDHGAKELEGYPVRPFKGGPAGADLPAAFAWTGVAPLFVKLRFTDVTPPGHTRDIYRKSF